MFATNIPEDIIRSGTVTLYADDVYTIEKDVAEYNKYIGECKIQHKQAGHVVIGYCILNPIALVLILLVNFNTAFVRGAFAGVMLAFYVIIFVVCAPIKRLLIFSTAAVPLLFFLDMMFISLFIADALFTYMYESMERPLRNHPTYPVFYEINIRYERGNRPKGYTFRD